MNCQLCQDELLLYAGQDRLPDDILNHLESCTLCREVWGEIQTITERLGDDNDFVPVDLNADQFVADVERKIEAISVRTEVSSHLQDQSERVTWIGWSRYLSAAAAILLLVGLSYIGSLESGKYANTGSVIFDSLTGLDRSAPLLSLYESEVDQFDDDVLSVILSDFGSNGYFEASELLLDDLSAEELQYLEENFDVGEVL
jgi:hypothetical protein